MDQTEEGTLNTEYVWTPQPGPQVMATVCPADIICFGGSRGGGKSLSNSSKLLTSKGWKKFSEVKVGGSCIDPETGGSQEVIGVYPQGEMDIYEVIFDDGAKVHITLDHLWTYKCANRKRPRTKISKQREYLRKETGLDTYLQGRYANFRVNTTERLIEELESGKHNPRIPLTAPVLFDVNGRTGTNDIPPYLIGLMLGDGTFTKGNSGNKVSTGDSEIAAYLESFGFYKEANNEYGWYLSTDTDFSRLLSGWAASHGLCGKTGKEKFVPGYIFTANVSYRLDVLRGFLDSDGYVDNRGHVEFTNVSDNLVFAVRDIVRSFGGKATVSEPITGTYQGCDGDIVECQTYRRAYIQSNIASSFFTLHRKSARCVDRWNGGYENMRKVVSIEYSHREQATCIKVSSPHGLFVTDDYVVTHNSDCAIGRQVIGSMQYGYAWNGLFLRKNFKHFNELRRRVDELIREGLPAIRVGGDQQTNTLKFDNGARVMMTAIEREEQLEFFQGQQITELSIEEGTQFEFLNIMIDKLKGCLRSPHGVPCHMFITCNPGGPGHNVIKNRFVDPDRRGGKIIDDGGKKAVFIPSRVDDNLALCRNDPDYVNTLKSIRDPNLRRAWLEGDWDVVMGGFFDDVWSEHTHVLRKFKIPKHWTRICGLDWGTAKPFSVGWFAVASGEVISELGYALPRGAIVHYREWYGCKEKEPNVGIRLNSSQVAEEIKRIEKENGEDNLLIDRVADPAIFKEDDGPSIAEKFAENDVVFRKGDNRRVNGWDNMRTMVAGKVTDDDKVVPMFYVTENCVAFRRLIPIMQRDEKDWDDIDTDQEDHCMDMARYVLMSRPATSRTFQDIQSESKSSLYRECMKDWEEIETYFGESEYEEAFGPLRVEDTDDGLPLQ